MKEKRRREDGLELQARRERLENWEPVEMAEVWDRDRGKVVALAAAARLIG
jgi:hypothetical protein